MERIPRVITMRSNRVLVVIDTLEVGGTEKSLLEIIRRFKTTRATVCHLFEGDSLKPEYERHGIEVISMNERGSHLSIAGCSRLNQLVRRTEPQVIHASLYRASILSRVVSRVTGTPLVDSLVNDSYGAVRYAGLKTSRRAKLRAVRLLDRATAPLADVFVANSGAIAESNRRALGIPASRIRVIHRGRDPLALEVAEHLVHEVRSELTIGEDRLILNVARLRERKGQRELVQAMAEINRSHPHSKLVIAGEGPFRGELEGLRDRLDLRGHVELLGRRHDVPALLGAADVFVFPSHYEGLPGALLEAMFAGLPIVASDIPVHRECLEHGVSGRLFPLEAPEAIAAAVCWVLEHPEEAKRMGRNAQRVANERFHIDQVALKHEALYDELINTKSGMHEDIAAD